MFWWAVPVGFTGFLLFVIFGLLFMFVMELMDGISLDHEIFAGIPAIISGVLSIIGLIMMIIGFLFWALGEIWTPYL